MMQVLLWTGALLVAYLLGAIPCGFLVARRMGVDIRATGSGNIGATNVFRTLGKGPGMLTFALDFAKGLVASVGVAAIPAALSGVATGRGLALACGCAAVAGHNWPVYLRFKGGKGVATSAGALVGVVPAAMGVAVAAWFVVFALGRYVSVASVAAAGVLAVAVWWLYGGEGAVTPGLVTALACVSIWRHKSNMIRLARGQEQRMQFGRRSAAKPVGEDR